MGSAFRFFAISLLSVATVTLSLNIPARAQAAESVIYTFAGTPDGGWPQAGLTFDGQGNLYGTTNSWGARGYGTVFQLTPSGSGWSENVIYDFCHNLPVCTDGAYPLAGVTFDDSGSLYGATSYGGSAQAWGTVYQLTPNSDHTWTQTVLFHLSGKLGDSYPAAGVTLDHAGHLFVTAQGNPIIFGLGEVFEMTRMPSGRWQRRILYTFTGKGGIGMRSGL